MAGAVELRKRVRPLYSLYFENWRLTALTVLLLVVSGLTAMNTLPKQEDPAISERFGQVSVFLPGASAERVESLLAEPMEQELLQVNEIDRVESSSLPGGVVVSIALQDRVSGDETDTVWAEISDRMERVGQSFPSTATAPYLDVRTTQADSLMVALSWNGEASPGRERLLQRLAEDLQQRFGAVYGTRSADLYGGSPERLLIEVDPAELVAAGLTVQDMAVAVRRKDSRRPGGQVDSGVSRIAMDLSESMATPEQVRNLQVQLPGGHAARLGDLARVRKSLGEPPDAVVLVDGRRSMLVAAKPELNQRVDAWTDRMLVELAAFRSEISSQITVEVVYDQSQYTVERLDSLMYSLLITSVIVFAVLVLFQGVRPAMVIALALPLTSLGVLALMIPFGVNLQQMSVTGLIISLGLLIDNPIVVVDHYQRLRREGQGTIAALRAAVGHLKTPLLASTLTTVFAFMPIVASQGSTSEFVGSIALTVILAVSLSLFLALTVIPALNAYWEGGSGRWSKGISNRWLTARYTASVDLVIRRPSIGIAIGLALPLTGFLLFSTLQRNFFPPVDRDMFQVNLSVWSAGSLRETEKQVHKVRSVLAETPGVGRDVWFVGGSAARPFYNAFSTDTGLKGAATAFVYTDSPEATRALLPDLQRRLRRDFPGMRIMVSPYAQGPPISAPLEIRLVGEDLEVMRDKSQQLRQLMLRGEQVVYAQSSLASPYPHFVLYPRQEELLASGITEAEIVALMAAALDGLEAGDMMDSGRQLPILIRFPEALRGDWQRLQGAPLLRAADGGLVPLEAVAEHRLEPGLRTIRHRDSRRADEIRGWLMPFELASDSLAEFRGYLDEANFSLPPGIKMEVGGESEESGDSILALLQTALFFMALMLFSVVLSFSSFQAAAIVASTAVLSIGLAMFGLRLTDQIFGFTAVIGTLGLVGLSINGTIIVLSALKSSEAASAGDPLAIREATLNSTRHILATTVTTVLGLSPLMLSNQTFWHPLIWTIAGGVSGSALIALYMIPALFTLRARRSQRAAGAQR